MNQSAYINVFVHGGWLTQFFFGNLQTKVEKKVGSGDAKDVICAAVRKLEADILVMGSHDYGFLKRCVYTALYSRNLQINWLLLGSRIINPYIYAGPFLEVWAITALNALSAPQWWWSNQRTKNILDMKARVSPLWHIIVLWGYWWNPFKPAVEKNK